MSIPENDFRKIMGRFTTGVAIVTTQHHGKPVGVTINTLTSVSLTPPLILFCLGKKRVVFPAIFESTHYAIHILSSQQEHLCHAFSRPSVDPWKDLVYEFSKVGCPLLAGSLGILHCRREATYEGGDHTIFLNYVEDIQKDNGAIGKPLIYFQGSIF
ncbi:MAG: flavin reductase family protein [Alphaproteobacteria bacterium]|nr:flavin reductase family protein [Alphaproteobacteria bacterium]